MELATIIVNYRTSAVTVDAVKALWGDLGRFPDAVVVVVDNDSRDGSLEVLTQAFADPKWSGRVVVLDSRHNGGFGFGVNFGIRHVLATYGSPRYFYVLNPDAEIDPGTLCGLVDFMVTHPQAGLLGNLIRNGPGDTTTGFRFPSLLGQIEGSARLGVISSLLKSYAIVMHPTSSTEVDWVSGVSMLFRGEVFTTVGLFDEAFFLYFEEVDLARRVKQGNWKIYFVEGLGVEHISGLSTGFNDLARRMPTYWFDSRRRYLVKHHGRLYAAACDLAWICGHAIFKTKVKLLRRPAVGMRVNMGRDLLRYGFVNALKPAPIAEQNASLPGWPQSQASAGPVVVRPVAVSVVVK
jgi:N-acetylglucosaminyl-diphospho-decaprenol L-rhamnosyltransferase